MRIEHIETYVAHNWTFVEVTTDTGIVGVGESTFFGFPEAAASIADAFGRSLLGTDPMRAEHHWLSAYRAKSMRGMAIMGAISAIDQALWDIRGKYFEAPVWQLLGGQVRDGVRAMPVLPTGTVEEVAEHATAAVRAGFSAIKVLLFQDEHHDLRYGARIDDLVRRARAVRDAVGWDVDIAIELHRNLSPGDSPLLINELASMRPYFVEDPCAPDSVMSFAEVASKVSVPMAAGERNTSIWEFREYLEHARVAFVRPDVGVAGGITHVRKICAIAEAHHAAIAPHAVPSGPVATASQVQLGACTPNWDAQEHRAQDGSPWSDVVENVARIEDGYFVIPDLPGLGISLDHEGLKNTPPLDKPPTAHLKADGTVALR
ncbi:galactonate dehydratase [Ilumatobacter fluminis]|uniref:Galactonate dehydratase n=1 Tax=Ilumatobacter fluminis TaxID=467091 RepID=A0A4R7HVP1_9ACTN|nr:enolase C-terminal domain-like protein [Ilumatobacter fluminis]TDT14915.1 galactonate dehydratase [Ilumatobacter fluminis]